MTDQTKIAVKGIYSALAAAQIDMGPALKDSTNPAFKTKYADLSSVMAACMPALNKHGICVIQPICDDDGKRYVKTVLAHEGGETLECRVELIIGKNDMQGYGSAVTYARRYGLMAMAGIAPEEDDGNAAAKAAPLIETPKETPRATYVTPSQIDDIVEKAFRADVTAEAIAKGCKVQGLDRILAQDFDAVMRRLDVTIAKKQPPKDDLGGDGVPY